MADENRPYRYTVNGADLTSPEVFTLCETNDLDVAAVFARNELADENGRDVVWIIDEVTGIEIPLKARAS